MLGAILQLRLCVIIPYLVRSATGEALRHKSRYNKSRNGAQRNDGRHTQPSVITLRFIPAFVNPFFVNTHSFAIIALRSIPAFVLASFVGYERIRIQFEMLFRQINTLYCRAVSISFLPPQQIRPCVNASSLSL